MLTMALTVLSLSVDYQDLAGMKSSCQTDRYWASKYSETLY